MSWLKTALRRTIELFADDGSFALAIVAWLAFVGVAASRLAMPAYWSCVVLFVGLAAILSESALRRARRHPHR